MSTKNSELVENSGPSKNGIRLAFVLLCLTAIGAIIGSRQKTNNKTSWGETFKQPAISAIPVLLIVNSLLYLFWYQVWDWIFAHQILFWGTNVSCIILAYCFFAPKETHLKTVAKIAALLIVLGFLVAAQKENGESLENWWKKRQEEKAKQTAKTLVPQKTSFDGVPMNVALPIIASCESGGHQFEVDEKGNFKLDSNGDKITLRGIVNPNDVGLLQINEKIHANLLAQYPELDIYKSEEDNYRFGEILVQKFQGYSPWYLSQHCWGPKLAERGYNNPKWRDFKPNGKDYAGFEGLRKKFGPSDVKTEEDQNEIVVEKIVVVSSENWGRTFHLDKEGVKPPIFSSPGNRFFVRFNAIRTVEFSPEGEVISEKGVPEKVRFFEIRSGEPDKKIPVNIKTT